LPVAGDMERGRQQQRRDAGADHDDLRHREHVWERDSGLRQALTTASSTISVVKGIHQEVGDNFPHVTVDYSGGRGHVNLVATAAGGVAGYRVGQCSQ
jgi:hypothetical protein